MISFDIKHEEEYVREKYFMIKKMFSKHVSPFRHNSVLKLMYFISLKKMINQFSTDDLNHYYQENLTHFHHNTKLVYDIVRDPLITYRKLNP